MDMDGECVQSFLTGSTTIIEEESDSEEDSGGAGSSFQPGSASAQLTIMGGNARPFRTRNGKRTLRTAVYLVLQEAGESLHIKEILGLIQAKKLYVFRRMDGSVSTDDEIMRDTVRSACSHSPRFVRTAYGRYAIAKEYLNRSIADNLNKQNSNATTTNNNTTSSPSPYALVLREALESGLMTEEEYAEAVQEALRYDSKSPEKKREIADYNEVLRIIFADTSLMLSDKEQCIVKREYLEEVGLCKVRPPSSKRTRSKTAPSIVKVKQEE